MDLRWLILLLVCASCSPTSNIRDQTLVAQQGLLSAAYSPNGKRLFTGAFQHGGALWDQPNKARLYNWNQASESYSAYIGADFSEDGKFVATTDGATTTIWNTTTGAASYHIQSPAQSLAITNSEEIWSHDDTAAADYWGAPARIADIAFSQQYLLLALQNQIALLVDVASHSVVGALAHQDSVSSVAMNDAATLGLTGSRSGEAFLWDLDNGYRIFDFKAESAVTFVDLSPSGNLGIIATYQGPVYLLDKDRQTYSLMDANPGVTSVRFNRTETEVLIGSARETIRQFDLQTMSPSAHWVLPKDRSWHRSAVLDIAFANDGIQVVASNGVVYSL